MRVVAHQQRRLDFGIAVLGRVQVEHELAERAFQPGKLALEHGEARAGDLGGALEIHQPSASPISKCSFGLWFQPGLLADHFADFSTLSCSSLPTGTSSAECWGCATARREFGVELALLLLGAGSEVLDLGDLGLQLVGQLGMSSGAMALPISLEAALRRDCMSCAFWMMARRFSSSAISDGLRPRASAPRRLQAPHRAPRHCRESI
jgi:hypothetical protein